MINSCRELNKKWFETLWRQTEDLYESTAKPSVNYTQPDTELLHVQLHWDVDSTQQHILVKNMNVEMFHSDCHVKR